MSKDAINQYDATAANNTDVGGISIDEGMLPSNVNNALREIMSHLKDVDAGTSSLTSPVISGNLLVGTTTLSTNTDGHELRADGKLVSSTSDAAVAYFNRNTSDGDIVRFDKSGSTVGSIGTASGFPYFAAPANFSLMLVTNDIRPRTVTGSSNNDNTVDIGTSSSRFKDLYLGGGIRGPLFLFSQTSGSGNATLKYTTGTGAVTYDTSSRLVKENIVDCPYGLAEIVQLQPRKYFRIDDQANEVGLIADEVQSIMPEFVPTGEKSLITGIEEDTEIIPLGVNYDKMVAPLVQAIKDLNAKVETLEAKVTALENA